MDKEKDKEPIDPEEKDVVKPMPSKSNMPSIICSACDVQGNVTFGKGCVVHPGCSILAEGGDIIIGDNNIIEERVVIYNKAPKEKPPGWAPKTMRIGSFNLFEVGTFVETSDIGSFNMFQHRAHLETGCTVKNACNIGAAVRVATSFFLMILSILYIICIETVLEDKTCMYYPNKVSSNSNFTEENHKIGILTLIEMLSKCLPKHNQLKQV